MVGLQLQNGQTSTLAAREITFGQQFAARQVPSGKGLVAMIGGVTVPVQMDVKTRYADGSVRTAVLTLQQPALAANSSTAVMLALGTASAAPPVDIAALTNPANYNVTVTLSGITEHSGSSSVKIADQSFNLGALLKQALASGKVSYWLQGPQATQVEFQTTLPGTPLRLVFDVTRYADGTTSTDVQFNNDIAMQASLGNQTTSLSYNVAIQQNGASVLQQNGITQWQYQTWQQQFWSNGAPLVNVQHDIAALEKTGLIQNFDLNLGVAGSVINNEASHLGGANFGILGPGDITKNMTWTAGRPDIGPQPRWVATWLVSQNGAAQTYMLAQANAAGAIPWHLYDPTTGNYVTATNYPTLWVTPRTGPTQAPTTLEQSGWVPDPSHQPDSDYIAYLATGDRYYLDQLNAQAAYDILAENPVGRQQSAGIVDDLKAPPRAQAWSLREIVEAAAANPDGSPMKAYFTQIAANNISYLLSQIPQLTAAEGAVSGWFPPIGGGVPGATTPWQQDFMATTFGLAAGLGIPGAAQVLAWQTNFLAGLFTNDAAGFPATDGVQYLLQVADPKTLTPYTTWAQVEAGSQAQGLLKNPPGVPFKSADYQASAKAALAESITWTGSTKAMQAYGWLLANATAASPAYDQSQPSEDIVPRLTDGNLLTASMVFIRNDVGAMPVSISGTGSDQLIYEKGSAPATITGGAGIDILFGGSGSTTLIGGGGNDDLYAGSGRTVFQPGAGSDFMQAGTGAATFDLSVTDIGNDLIAGFKLATDRLSIVGDAPGSAALTTLLKGATQDASGNAVLHLAAGHDVTLLGIAQTQLAPALFS